MANSDYQFNRNYSNDGKLDQNKIPANANGVAKIEIAVARIDLSFMTGFADSETELLKKYFKKDADFRNGVRTFAAEGMIGEYVVPPPGIPASPMAFDLANELISKASVLKQPIVGDVFTDTRSFLFGVQSGPGFFDRINDAYPNEHTTAQIGAGQTSTNCAFYFLRASYFPDWNSQGNKFLRAPLGMPNGGLISAAFLGINERLARRRAVSGLSCGQRNG